MCPNAVDDLHGRKISFCRLLDEPLDGKHEESSAAAGRIKYLGVEVAIVLYSVQYKIGEPIWRIVLAQIVSDLLINNTGVEHLEQILAPAGTQFRRCRFIGAEDVDDLPQRGFKVRVIVPQVPKKKISL